MRKIPNVLNKDEIRRLLDNVDEPWLMTAILLGLFCGLRRNEVASLKVQDADLTSKRLKIVNSKNPNKTWEGYGKDRIVPLPECLIPILRNWMEILGYNTTYLFPSIKDPNTHIKGEQLWKVYKQALRRANLDPIIHTDKAGMPRHKFNFHTLRHTYATLLWEKTGDILTVKHALGHSKLDTTMIYTHVTNKVVEEKVNEAFGGYKKQNLSINANKQLDPMGILMRRLALGEIDKKTFNLLRGELRREKKEQNEYIG